MVQDLVALRRGASKLKRKQTAVGGEKSGEAMGGGCRGKKRRKSSGDDGVQGLLWRWRWNRVRETAAVVAAESRLAM